MNPEHRASSRGVRVARLSGVLLTAALLLPAILLAAPAETKPPAPPAPGAAPAAAQKPKDPARELLDSGWQEMRFANWPKAQEILEGAIDKCARREDKAEAIFALANLCQTRQPGADVPRAKTLYERVVRDYADTPATPWAHLTLARLADNPEYEKHRDVETARRLYIEIMGRYPDHPAADEAALRLGMSYLEKVGNTVEEDRGAAILENRLAARPDNFLAPLAHMMLGDLDQRRKKYREAVDHWVISDPGVTGITERAALYYKIAWTAENELKDYALAAKWWDRLVTDARHENRYYVAKLGAERCRRLLAESPKPAASATPAAPKPPEGGRP